MQRIDETNIQRELFRLNIPFDMIIIKEVHSFLDKFIGPLTVQQAQYHIPAACAIICQTIKMPTVDHSSLTGTGVRIENVMRHIGNLSKERFLETIETQIKKSNFSNHSLIEKVGKIKISFRVFKKFKTIFQNLGTKNGIPFNVNHQLFSLFWIIFLIIKFKLNAEEDLNLSTKILVLIIQEVFSNYYGRQPLTRIRDYISHKDNFAQLEEINQEERNFVKGEIYAVFNQALKGRDPEASPNSNSLLNNPILLNRLVDDLNSQYEKIYQCLPENRFIDQMTFLELSKNLTPQAFSIKPQQKPISKVINFGDDDDDDDDIIMKDQGTAQKKPYYQENQSPAKGLVYCSPTFNQITQPKHSTQKKARRIEDLTPVSLGQTKSNWARGLITNYEREYSQKIKNYFSTRGIDYQNFVNQAKRKIQVQINQLTKYIDNKDKQVNEILIMSLSLAAQILDKNSSIDLLGSNYFKPLLCISTFLYNSTIRYLSLGLQKYSMVYEADLVDCLIVIYNLSDCVDLPLFVKQMLQELEKQTIIRQLWESDRGYKILTQRKNQNNKIIFNRLQRRIYERIREICSANKVQLTEVTKIQALVNQIMEKKSQIFIRNKLDQIIICSISACLNLNEAKYNLALSTIFQKYNQIPLSLQTNREVIASNESQSEPQTLLQFYNQVFIHEVQDMMSKQKEPKYLYTPIRKTHIINNQMNRISSQKNPFSTFNSVSRLSGDGGQSYRKHIIEKMRQRPREEEEDNEDDGEEDSKNKQSPTFGFGLQRKHTFGPGGI